MNGCNFRIAGEVALIECQQVSKAMNLHGRHQARVVDLLAGNGMGDYQLPPLPVNLLVVGQ